ncbi:MAG TPA: VWA domain-containing protein [Candidatus Eisenbacteria bacterium]|nr:VWA domain-containing protein [Candidatus Eisenbacteria bacterium]
MRFRSIFPLVLLLAFASSAQDANQQPLPSAPSAHKYPAQNTETPAVSTPAQTAPATQSGPAPSAAPSAQAQQPAQESDQEEKLTTIVKQVDEVNVVFTVTDKRGKFVNDLKQDDFKVIDDNKPAQAIRSFRSETNLPLRVGLLIDASNSIRDRFKFEQEAAIEFLNQIIHQQDQAFVLGFDTTPEVTQNFTNNTEALSKGVRTLRPGGGTAMYDAIYYACRDEIMAKDKGPIATRRAIILLSDGDDNQSRVSREEAVEMAQKAEVIIYTISTNSSGMKLKGDKVLEHFAEETGGRSFFPFKVQDVSDAFLQIQDELRSQYAISYKPAELQPNGKYHSIQILADNKKYKVRARKGYYAPLR